MKPPSNPDRFYHVYNHANGRENLFEKWKYSSYLTILSTLPTEIKRVEVIAMFGGREGFIAYHQRGIDNNMISDLEG